MQQQKRMNILALVAGALLLIGSHTVRAHTGPPVIVDTDMAADDARALALLLASPFVEVVAVVTSDGVSPPDVGATNVCRILRFLKHDDVAVGVGRTLTAVPPPFRANAVGLDWNQLGEPALPRSGWAGAVSVILQLVSQHPDERVLYICLGPLTNLADALEKNPDLAERIEAVIWSGTPANSARPDWNARRDLEAVKKIAASGLRVEAVHWAAADAPVLDDALLNDLRGMDSRAADLIVRLHSAGRGGELVRARHLRLWDDLVALRLTKPSLVTNVAVHGQALWREVTPLDAVTVRNALPGALRLLPPRGTVVLADFPASEPSGLLPDMREIAPQIIARHGVEEWKATVLTSELHRHLGTYSIVGAKMGLRAREFFEVDLDELQVESHAGLKPPLSCVNDGLQVATGASLGRGTITVLTNATGCEAVFIHDDQRLRLRLKPEFAKRIATDMAELAKRHGGTTPAYFQAVRGVSLQHWLNFDRHTMFEEASETVPAKP